MVYPVDGIMGREVKSAEKHLASFLMEKWKREHSHMVFYVRVRMVLYQLITDSYVCMGTTNFGGVWGL